jgi:hypothetical protein
VAILGKIVLFDLISIEVLTNPEFIFLLGFFKLCSYETIDGEFNFGEGVTLISLIEFEIPYRFNLV